MKISKLKLRFDFQAFAYEKASPYTDKFDEILQKTTESGILKIYRLKQSIRIFSENNSLENEDILSKQLAGITIVGCITATVAFLWELRRYLKKQQQCRQIVPTIFSPNVTYKYQR